MSFRQGLNWYNITDGNEFNKNGEVPDTPPSKREAGIPEIYITEKGKVLHVPGGASPGDRVWTPNSYDEDLDFDLDYVVGPSNETGV